MYTGLRVCPNCMYTATSAEDMTRHKAQVYMRVYKHNNHKGLRTDNAAEAQACLDVMKGMYVKRVSEEEYTELPSLLTVLHNGMTAQRFAFNHK